MAEYTDKTIYNMVYNRDTDTLSGDTLLTFTENAPAGIRATQSTGLFFGPPNYLDYTISGNTINFANSKERIKNNTDFPQTGEVNFKVLLVEPGPNERVIGNFFVSILFEKASAVPGEGKMSVNVNEIDIYGDEGSNVYYVSENLEISNPNEEEYNIDFPNFINGNKQISGVLDRWLIGVNPNETFSEGEYEGYINIVAEGFNHDVKVRLIIKKNADADYEEGQINFCLDKKYLRINKTRPTSVMASIRIKFNVTMDGNNRFVEQEYTVPFFNGVATLDVGEKVQHHFDLFSTNLLGKNGYFFNYISHAAATIITIKEINEKFEPTRDEFTNLFVFFPGKKPKHFPLLTNHSYRSRKRSSKILLNFVGNKSFGEYGLLRPIPIGDAFDINTLKITEEEINFPLTKDIDGIKYVTLPEADKAIHIQWLNQNLVPDWATFTGEYSIETAFTHTINKGVFSSLKKKFNTEKERVLKINTGFILKAETEMIEEMMQSPFCYLEFENEIIKGIPQSEKITLIDSTAQLINFELEFLIVENGN